MGWTKEDVRGSLTEIEIEMTEAVNEWKLECDRDEGLDDPKQYLQDVAALLSLFSVKPSGPTAKKNLAGDVAAGTFAIPSKTPSTQKLRQANLAVLKRQVFGSPNKVKQMTPLVSSQSSGIALLKRWEISICAHVDGEGRKPSTVGAFVCDCTFHQLLQNLLDFLQIGNSIICTRFFFPLPSASLDSVRSSIKGLPSHDTCCNLVCGGSEGKFNSLRVGVCQGKLIYW